MDAYAVCRVVHKEDAGVVTGEVSYHPSGDADFVTLMCSCDELLGACCEAVVTTRDWLGGVLEGRFRFWVSSEKKRTEWEQRVDKLKFVRARLLLELAHFRREKRRVISEALDHPEY